MILIDVCIDPVCSQLVRQLQHAIRVFSAFVCVGNKDCYRVGHERFYL